MYVSSLLILMLALTMVMSIPFNNIMEKREYDEASRIARLIADEIEGIDRLNSQDPNRLINYTLNIPQTINGKKYVVLLLQHYVKVTVEDGITANQTMDLTHTIVSPSKLTGGTIHLECGGGILNAYNIKG